MPEAAAPASALAVLGLLAPLAASEGGDFDVEPGLSVERAAAANDSFLCLTLDPVGIPLASSESRGLLRLADGDGDGFLEIEESFEPRLVACQGLDFDGATLYAVGVGPLGDDRRGAGLFRRSAGGALDVLLEFTDAGEHGPHGLALGPDGFLYVTVGDQAAIVEAPAVSRPPLAAGYEAAVLEPLRDPNGFGALASWPQGFVARVDPASGAWELFAVGLRNAYDLAFDAEGELFTIDSDMEWDVGLPWYRPVRALHVVATADFGRRQGSSVWPEHYLDSLPAMGELGRGSPTGLVVYEHERLAADLRGALVLGDWSRGRIVALRRERSGAGWIAAPWPAEGAGIERELVRAARPLNVTDLVVDRDGSLLFCTGGRGTPGGLYRLDRAGEGEESPARAAETVGPPAVAAAPPREDLHAQDAATNPFARRAAVEALLADPGPLDAPALVAALEDPERLVRFLARGALERLGWRPPARREEEYALGTRRGIEELCLEARRSSGRDDDDKRRAWERAVAMLSADLPVDAQLDLLRCIQLLAPESPSPGEWAPADLAPELTRRLAHADGRVRREARLLLARWPAEDTVSLLLEELGSAPTREESIHVAFCLRAVPTGWSGERWRDFLDWFELAGTWTGGGSFAGYLAEMHRQVVERVPLDVGRELVRADDLGPRTLAWWIARGEGDASAIDRLAGTFAALESEEDLDAGQVAATREAVLRALGGEHRPELVGWYRAVAAEHPRQRDAALVALARAADEQDFELLVSGLSSPGRGVAAACAAALRSIERVPEDPERIAVVIEAARRHGSARGRVLLEVLEHWTRDAQGAPRVSATAVTSAASWESELRAWQDWLLREHPETVTERGPFRRPTWSVEDVVRFLERSSARPGSPARGRRVWQESGCGSCHLLGPSAFGAAAGAGPDLTTAARRLGERELLESIVYPSQVVSDQYRTTIVRRITGRTLEGRLVEDAPDAVALLLVDGSRVRLPREEVSAIEASPASLMPEGLLADRTLEEAKDLLALLRAEGRVDPADARGSPWSELLAGGVVGGWEGGSRHWRVRDGVLRGLSDGIERSEYLTTGESFADFELELDVRLSRGGNSGLQYRSRREPGGADPIGYQADLGQEFWGGLYATDGRGFLERPGPRRARRAVRPTEWNHLFLRVEGARHRIEINGIELVDTEDARHASGVLGFQLHAGEPMRVLVANLRLRRLP